MTHLFLLRHGETEENAKHILQGHMPGTLTPTGIEQAIEAVEQLRSTAFDVCLSSDLKRCVDTTNIILEHLDQDIPVIYTKQLRERDWGSITGMIVEKGKWVDRPDDVESMPAFRARAKSFLDYVSSTYPDANVLVVSHGLFLRILQAVHKNIDHKEITPMTNAKVRQIDVE